MVEFRAGNVKSWDEPEVGDVLYARWVSGGECRELVMTVSSFGALDEPVSREFASRVNGVLLWANDALKVHTGLQKVNNDRVSVFPGLMGRCVLRRLSKREALVYSV